MKRFIVKRTPDIAYVSHEVELGKRKIWCYSFLGRDGNLYQTSLADSEADADAKAAQAAETHGTWPKNQPHVVMWNLGGRY